MRKAFEGPPLQTVALIEKRVDDRFDFARSLRMKPVARVLQFCEHGLREKRADRLVILIRDEIRISLAILLPYLRSFILCLVARSCLWE